MAPGCLPSSTGDIFLSSWQEPENSDYREPCLCNAHFSTNVPMMKNKLQISQKKSFEKCHLVVSWGCRSATGSRRQLERDLIWIKQVLMQPVNSPSHHQCFAKKDQGTTHLVINVNTRVAKILHNFTNSMFWILIQSFLLQDFYRRFAIEQHMWFFYRCERLSRASHTFWMTWYQKCV